MLKKILIAVFSLSMICADASSLDTDFDTVLGLAGLGRDSARFDTDLMAIFRDAEFPTAVYQQTISNPWRTPFFMQTLRTQLDGSITSPQDSVQAIARMLGISSRRSLLGSPIKATTVASAKKGYLKAVLTKMKEDRLLAEIPDLTGIPEPVQQAAAIILKVASDSVPYRRASFAKIGNVTDAFNQAVKTEMESDDPEVVGQNLELMRRVDMKPLLAAGSDLTEAVNEASIAVATVSPAQRYKLTFKTAWGMVVLAGGSTETYANEIPTCLIIDTGGNDAYINQPANKGAANWLSVVIDTDGKDRYVSDPALLNTELSKWGGRKKRQELGPAGAAFGFSFLTDTQGDDVYTSHLAGLGSAFFGVAVLQDWAGADRYYGYKNCEGAATFGVGLLEDRKGDDVYHAFTQAQGFGGIQGGGGVIDRDGNDRYTAEDTIIDFPSAQSAQHNTSFAQGSALGRRADYLEGHSLAGGFGFLYDEAGDDRYSASVFGQGAGYWAGVGALMDNSGDDQYSGQWYVQGAAAHFAVGYLEDIAGKDLYRAPMNMAMGAGHDFSLGMLIEGGGSDSYNAPNLSLGAGNANGMGVFVDKGGDDFYTSTGITLGMSADSPLGTLREIALSLGVFIDFGGDDSFPVTTPHAKNSTRTANWVRRQAPAESLVGVFLDK